MPTKLSNCLCLLEDFTVGIFASEHQIKDWIMSSEDVNTLIEMGFEKEKA